VDTRLPSRREQSAAAALAAIGRVERAVTFGAFAVLIVVLFADVVSREVSGSGLVWARQLGVYANLVLTMVGIGVASADGAHLRPRFADRWLPAALDAHVERVGEALMAVFCLAFAVAAAVAVAETRALGERTPMPAWLVWPFQAVLPAVFLVASARHALFATWPRLRPPEAGEAAPAGAGTPP
jgi:TRAP-type C4-dicarboxylate transport system permease small subunit